MKVDYSCIELLGHSYNSNENIRNMDRKTAMPQVINCARTIVNNLYNTGKIDGIIGMGGSGGTTISAEVMRDLPIGFPKVIVSTLGGATRIADYVGIKDMLIINSVVDIAGINTLLKRVICEAAGAVVGAARSSKELQVEQKTKKRIAMTMYGLTTKGVVIARKHLESLGYEVTTFHATGQGGKAMESLIRQDFFDGILDMTLPEVNSYVLDVEYSNPGEGRLYGAIEKGLPCVLCPGAMDMVSTNNFLQYSDRVIYSHSNKPSHFRTNAEDLYKSGTYMVQVLNKAKVNCALLLPIKGLSEVDAPGKPMYNPQANKVLFDTLQNGISNPLVRVEAINCSVNDKEFALKAANCLDSLIKASTDQY